MFKGGRYVQGILAQAFQSVAQRTLAEGQPVFIHLCNPTCHASESASGAVAFFRLQFVSALLEEGDDVGAYVLPFSTDADFSSDECQLGIDGGDAGEEQGYFPKGVISTFENAVDVTFDCSDEYEDKYYRSGQECEVEKVFDCSDEIFHGLKFASA